MTSTYGRTCGIDYYTPPTPPAPPPLQLSYPFRVRFCLIIQQLSAMEMEGRRTGAKKGRRKSRRESAFLEEKVRKLTLLWREIPLMRAL